MKPYTCNDYRQEMILVGLRKQLAASNLGCDEKKRLEALVRRLEEEMGLE